MDDFVCPICGSSLYPSDFLFLKDGRIVGCEKCYGENDNAWANGMMVVEDYLNPNCHYFPNPIN